MDRSGAWLGGSDFASVFSLEPYGCRRQLWYTKRGQKPDYPPQDKGVFRRGHALEPIIAGLYSESTGRKLVKRTKWPKSSISWMRGQPDRHITANQDGRGGGVLEIKTSGIWMFRKFVKEGLPQGYILQLQFYLWLARAKWGAFAILEAENWNFKTFEVERDEQLIGSIERAGHKFIREVENGPDPERLDPNDKRCGECPFRSTCQKDAWRAAADKALGEGLEEVKVLDSDEGLERLLTEHREMKNISDEATEKLNEIKDGIRTRMKEIGSEAVQVPGNRVYHRASIRKTLDSKRLRKDLPAIADKYTRAVESTSLRIYSL